MAHNTDSPSHLVDVSHLADDARPVLDWFEWYADPNRSALDPDAVGELVSALEGLVPYTALDGPVGHATAVLVAGGLGHSTDAHLDALDTLDAIAHPTRDEPAPWHHNRQPRTDLDIPHPQTSEVGSGAAIPLQLPGVIWPEPIPRRRTR